MATCYELRKRLANQELFETILKRFINLNWSEDSNKFNYFYNGNVTYEVKKIQPGKFKIIMKSKKSFNKPASIKEYDFNESDIKTWEIQLAEIMKDFWKEERKLCNKSIINNVIK